jgi:hypothetical protein
MYSASQVGSATIAPERSGRARIAIPAPREGRTSKGKNRHLRDGHHPVAVSEDGMHTMPDRLSADIKLNWQA